MEFTAKIIELWNAKDASMNTLAFTLAKTENMELYQTLKKIEEILPRRYWECLVYKEGRYYAYLKKHFSHSISWRLDSFDLNEQLVFPEIKRLTLWRWKGDYGQFSIQNFPNLYSFNIEYAYSAHRRQELELLPPNFSSLAPSLKELTWVNRKEAKYYYCTIGEALGQAVNLQKLIINAYGLLQFPESLANLSSLRELEANDNRFEVLPEYFGFLEKLETCSLQRGALKTLPNSISMLENLRVLNLKGQQLTTLPKGLERMQSLEDFFLSENPIKEFPSGLSGLPQLKVLSMNTCQLKEIRLKTLDLANLQTLNLSKNPLEYLGECIAQLPRLKTLTLAKTALKTLPIFPASSVLENLDLSKVSPRNFLEAIRPCQQLKQLILGRKGYTEEEQEAIEQQFPFVNWKG